MDQSFTFYPARHGRELIAQIRRDISAAWEQIEAGRAILERSAWLLQRWREQAHAPSIVAELGRDRPSVAGMYIEVEEPRRPVRRRPRRPARSRSREPQAYPVA
jgi:hypothetical protein